MEKREKPHNREGYCVSFSDEKNYYDVFICPDSKYCCGKIPHQKCCPKLPGGAIFGIVITAVVLTVFVVCCVFTCCTWCDCCLYRRLRGKRKEDGKKQRREIPIEQDDTDQTLDQPTTHPLTLHIRRLPESAEVLEPLNSAGQNDDVMFAESSPITPTTPMSISSPSEFSNLIAHDWTRLRVKETTNPYSDIPEPEKT